MLNLLISILLSFSSTARPHLNPINLYSTETAGEDYGYQHSFIDYDPLTGEETYTLCNTENDNQNILYDSQNCVRANQYETISSLGGISTNAIIGSDDRVLINPTNVGPYCNTVKLAITRGESHYLGSGFVIGEKFVMTCRHCVYDQTDGWVSSVTVIPAQNGSIHPCGTYSVEHYRIGGSFSGNDLYNDDWAILRVNGNIGVTTGWLGVIANGAPYNTTVSNTGYPLVVNGVTDGNHMYLGTGKVTQSNGRVLKGKWDASGGNSGGPIYVYDNSAGYCLVGILSGGSSDNALIKYTQGVRIDTWLYNTIVSFRYAEE